MKSILPVAIIVNLAIAAPAMAAFTLNNDHGGDGFVVVDPFDARIFTLFGANNAIDLNGLDNLTTYGTQSSSVKLIDVRWRYTSQDSTANWDPAGWFVNNDYYQLTDDNLAGNVVQGGRFQIAVNPGDQWGYYVYTTDGEFGRGALTISTVPEPDSWALLIAGFGLTGATLRRRRAIAA
jgi:hypothetical protein